MNCAKGLKNEDSIHFHDNLVLVNIFFTNRILQMKSHVATLVTRFSQGSIYVSAIGLLVIGTKSKNHQITK